MVHWRLVTHCAIDRFGRPVVYVKCSSNNLFLSAMKKYGLPSRIRCDQGREKIDLSAVEKYGLLSRIKCDQGREKNCCCKAYAKTLRRREEVGSSVHNQRIGSLWRDMHRCVTSLNYKLFYYLEHNELLNPIDNIHIFSLNYIFIPQINHYKSS